MESQGDPSMPFRATVCRLASALICIAATTNLAAGAIRTRPIERTSEVGFIHVFHGSDGANPTGQLVMDAHGALYGTTINGGKNGVGVAYRLVPAAGRYTAQVLYDFGASQVDGAHPQGGVTLLHGIVYGTTLSGGGGSCASGAGCGTVFALAPSAGGYHETILHAFQGGHADGAVPAGGVIVGSGGALYGATSAGGVHDQGTVFTIEPAAGGYSFAILHSFGRAGDGQGPLGLVADGSGTIFGVTTAGGSFGQGTAFALAAQGARYREIVLHDFGGRSDGGRPAGHLSVDERGALYGATVFGSAGVSQCCGTAFKLIPNGSGGYDERVLFDFARPSEGVNPSPLLAKPHGIVYGTALDGGGSQSRGHGAVFALMPVGDGYSELILHSFTGGHEGASPSGGLITDHSGALYGVTANGGSQACTRGCGVVYELRH
jgi:uncharacterized repeat protein (TIGR03803 family)